MSDDTPGAGQGALHPREGQNLRNTTAAERPTMRLTQVAGGQYVLTTQQHGVPALAQLYIPRQLSPGNVQQGVTRIINISPSRGQTSPLRPSVSNQSIVNVLTNRATPNARLQVFANNGGVVPSTSSGVTTPIHSRMAKRPLSSTPEKKDSYAVKLQRVTNHRIVKSKLLKEKYAENLLELFYLETGGNILDLYQYAKRPKTSDYVAYLKEHAIDAEEYLNYSICIPYTTPSTPTATSASSLPGSSFNSTQSTTPVIYTPSSPASVVSDNLSSIRMSTTSNSTICTSQEQIVEKAKQEAYVVQRVNELQKEGLWSEKRLPKIQEMPRCKAHWDYLLEEMVWLAADFAQERKWKKAAAKKCARMVQKYFQDKSLAALKAAKAQEQHLRRIASFCAKEVKLFWCNVEKLVEYKQNTILEEKRKRALDQQLSFIVDQTEKYSQLLAEGMNKSAVDLPSAKVSGQSALKHQSDDEFDPHEQSEEDDEETIAQEEAALGNFDQSAEVEALQRESQLELDDLLEDDFLKDYLLNRDNIRLSGSDDSDMESEEKKSKKSDPESAGSRKSSNKAASEKESKSDSSESDDDLDSDDESNSEELTNSQVENQSLKLLMGDLKTEGERAKTDEKDALINDAAAIAESIQPKGNTLSSTTVSTKVPFLLKLPLREYQHIGLEWLVTMYDRKLNGILADEMGLGKTIQTIALLAHLACEKENWGPHLIVVPTSVMLNWEMECKKWCPAFKILTYYGSQKERKMKRTGWTKPNMFHICITSYKLVIQDHQSFRRKKWKYLILDEAQNIKNFKSQRWQLLLNFQTERRLLLTGTPLQNNLMELWSLMHFLMPNVFQSHREFKEWFSNPVTGMIEGNSEYNESIIKRLHKVLRPFLLRRLKSEVEKQMPKKYEHVVMCRLSKRQRFLYDDYMSRANTRETLASGNLLSVINVLMQLRKVCNHPNLFEVRPTISPFQCENIEMHVPSIVYSAINYDVFKNVDLYALNLVLIMLEMHLGAYQCYRLRQSWKRALHLDQASSQQPLCPPCKLSMKVKVRDIKQENKEMVVQARNVSNAQPNVKMKVAGLQVLSQGVVKTVPLINISQAAGGKVQLGTPINVSSVLKPSDKVPTSFAQLVQTSTGKHLLLTSNPNRTGSVPVSQATAGGQKLTFLSTKQPIVTNVNTPQAITKAFVKFQLTSVTTGTTTTSSNSTATARVGEDGMRSVNSNFLGQLYSKQNNLDVRWRKDDNRRISNQIQDDTKNEYKRRLQLMARINERRCSALPLYGRDFQDVIKIYQPNTTNSWNGGHIHCLNVLFDKNCEDTSSFLKDALYSPERRIEELKEISDRFIFYVPAVKTKEPEIRVWHPPPSEYWARFEEKRLIKYLFSKPATPLHHIASAMVTQFPDPRLIQYDCGKLQTLDKLLRHLKTDSHRVLIFTQMTKMLDVLEAFLNFHGYIYLRLDGTTKVDQRQVLMERFNGDKRIFAFILSTRSGGVGVNLTGADTVVFYDSDWNPTMDAQAQDRCHRIGQTRDVHIYRLVSERTIEENILKKANQKRLLGDLAIEGGNFTTAYFKSTTIQDLFNIDQTLETAAQRMSEIVENSREVSATPIDTAVVQSEDKSAAGALETALAACEDDQDVQAAKIAKAEAVADLAEFDENIPLEQDSEREPEVVSKAEQEINNIIKKLSPIEKYAMKFIEQTESAWSAEQLAAAARQIEEQKREWEEQQMAAMREEEERRQRELEEENDMITYSREDATNQVSLKHRKHTRFRKVFRRTKAGVKVLKRKQSLQTKVPRSKRLKRLASKAAIIVKTDDGGNSSDPVEEVHETEDFTEAAQDPAGECSLDSIRSESDLTLSELKESGSIPAIDATISCIDNHVDHNSPRTRSRGTVAINLWTLDVSPILPSIKRIRNKVTNSSIDHDCKKIAKKRKSCSDDEGKDLNSKQNNFKSIRTRTRRKAAECAETNKKSPATLEETECELHNSNNVPSQVICNDIDTKGENLPGMCLDENGQALKMSRNVSANSLDSGKNGTCPAESLDSDSKHSSTELSVESMDVDEIEQQHETIILNNPSSDVKHNVDNEWKRAVDVDKEDIDSFVSEYEEKQVSSNAFEDVKDNENSFMSEYERELRKSPEPKQENNCDNASTIVCPKGEFYVATYVNTNGVAGKHRLEMPKENVQTNNTLRKTFNRIAFKPPESRKNFKQFDPSSNQTLDTWVTRSTPPSNMDS
ncbi:hypothetical protein HUJ04_001962 [Dendroctonus ponderosae]|nr:hypothetical protein HUJ04_001962 [Dendroctonus ponderosae]